MGLGVLKRDKPGWGVGWRAVEDHEVQLVQALITRRGLGEIVQLGIDVQGGLDVSVAMVGNLVVAFPNTHVYSKKTKT